MGVRGLQSFLVENRQSLCRNVILDRDGAGARSPVPVVVDAWGIMYQLYLGSLPWTTGGEYLRFYRITRRLIRVWRSVGLEPTFVFDGASPPEKHDTLLQRLATQPATARMFYTISATTRSSPSFSRGNQTILPPLTSQTFARALASLDVTTKFVPSGEADGMCVVIAEQLGGYVLGKDTDFIILASNAGQGLQGYCPLDMMEWIEGAPPEENTAEGGSFTTVAPRKQTGRSSRLLPPQVYRNPTLVLATFTSESLCRRLRLPATWLALLSSLVGNDYTPELAAQLFFPQGSKPTERIERVARILREQLARPSTGSKGDAAAEIVSRVIRKLNCRPYIIDGEVAKLTDAIIDATMQYILPPREHCCSTYPFCGDLDAQGCKTTLSRMSTPAGTPAPISEAVSAYAGAQSRGFLNHLTHAWLYPNRMYMWGVLENPSGPSTRASELAVAARREAYTIADEALGGLRWPSPSPEEIEALNEDREACKILGVTVPGVDDEDDDTDTSTVTDDEDTDSANSAEAYRLSFGITRPRRVIEYMRQGSSNRVIQQGVDLPPALASDPPICLRPITERLKLYLDHLGACTPEIEALPPRLHPLVAAVRLCAVAAAEGDVSGQRRWRRDEVAAVVRAGMGCLAGWDELADNDGGSAPRDDSDDDDNEPPQSVNGDAEEAFDDTDLALPLLTNRNAELVAQFSATLLDAYFLAQSLLLLPDPTPASPSGPLTHCTPFVFFSGTALHTLLLGEDPPRATGWRWTSRAKNRYRDVLAATLADLPEDTIGFAHSAVPKQSPKAKKSKRNGAGKQNGSSGTSMGSRFSLLQSEMI